MIAKRGKPAAVSQAADRHRQGTMGCGDECPNVRAKHREDWKIPDPKHLEPAEFANVRDIIAQKVQELIERL